MRRSVVPAVAIAVAIVAVAVAWLTFGERDRRARLALGERVYADQCASCHGDNLEGQPDWQTPLPSGRLPAPPHDASGHTWHHSDEELFTITKEGMSALVPGYESDMPAYADILSDDEIRAVIDFIRESWPAEERAYQTERNK